MAMIARDTPLIRVTVGELVDFLLREYALYMPEQLAEAIKAAAVDGAFSTVIDDAIEDAFNRKFAKRQKREKPLKTKEYHIEEEKPYCADRTISPLEDFKDIQ